MTAKKKYHHGNLRLACIETGLRLINEKGVQSFSLRDVARELGVSHNAPYSHFKSKEDLVAAIIEYGYSLFGMQLMSRLTALAVAPANPRSSIQAAALTYIEFAKEQPDYYRLLFNHPIEVARYPKMKESGSTHFIAIHRVLQQLQKDGQAKVTDSFQAAVFALSVIHGFSSLIIDGRFEFLKDPDSGSGIPEKVEIEKTLESVVDMLCDTMGIPPTV